MYKKTAVDASVSKIRFLIITVFLLIFIFGIFYFLNKAELKVKNKTAGINSFEECKKAGQPVMESYPRKCAVNGKTFTENLSQDQINQLSPRPEDQLKNFCGDGICQQVACLAIGCPKPETKESCPKDCK